QRLLEQFLGGNAAGGLTGKIPGMDQLAGKAGGNASGFGGFGGGALTGGVLGLLLGTKGGRKLASNAMLYGGMAAIGGIAYKAYKDWQAQQQSAPQQASQVKTIDHAVAEAEGTR